MGRFARTLSVAVIGVVVCLWAAPAWADMVVFSETFDGSDLPDTLTYTASAASPPEDRWSIDGSNRLFIDYDPGPPELGRSAAAITKVGFTDPSLAVVYSLDVGKPEGAATGGYNVGMTFGSYYLLFHPGYSGGAFRMGGGHTQGNKNMGFSPKMGVMHHVEAVTAAHGSDLRVDITITGLGTDDLMHEFNYSFIDTTPNIGSGTFGGRRSGGGDAVSDVFFDNFKAVIVPEPASLALLAGGAFALLRRRRTR